MTRVIITYTAVKQLAKVRDQVRSADSPQQSTNRHSNTPHSHLLSFEVRNNGIDQLTLRTAQTVRSRSKRRQTLVNGYLCDTIHYCRMGVMPLFKTLHRGALLDDVDCVSFYEVTAFVLSNDDVAFTSIYNTLVVHVTLQFRLHRLYVKAVRTAHGMLNSS